MAEQSVSEEREQRIRVATASLAECRALLEMAQAELVHSPQWKKVQQLREMELRLLLVAVGLVDEAEHAGERA